MTVTFAADRDLAADMAEAGVPATIRLGMPHLCLGGLSETWLLKELGHRHWGMLARAAGRLAPDFRDEAGEPIYAAFNAVRIEEADFASLGENDLLTITGSLSRLSRTQVLSRHVLTACGRPVGRAELVSVFVRRREKGRNRSVVRCEVEGLPAVEPGAGMEGVAALAPEIRAGRLQAHFGFALDEPHSEQAAPVVVDPVPTLDFNGANFLYFASFQAFVDRAEWALFRGRAGIAATRARDVVYFGNIEPGERVVVTCLGARERGDTLVHRCRLTREDTGDRLAEVFTERVFRR